MGEEKFNSFNLVFFFWKKRRVFFIVCGLTAVLSLIASFLIQPQYKSSVIIYPPRTNSIAKILTAEQSYNEKLDIRAYGIDEEVEQMLQILSSRDLKNKIVKKFNMAHHYGIDTNKRYGKAKLNKAVDNNWTFKRTAYGAIAINVTDVDPKWAQEIALEISNELDSMKNSIEKTRATAAYHYLLKHIENTEAEIERLNDSVKLLMSYGVYDFERQSERVMQQYAAAVAQGNDAAIRRLQSELEKLSTYGPKILSYKQSQEDFGTYLAVCRGRLMDAKLEAETVFPQKFVIEMPECSDKKVYPNKALIITLSTIGAFILTAFLLLLLDAFKNASSKLREENAQ